MTTPSIITIGDTNYFLTIAMSAILAKKYHPDIDFYVYDWGLRDIEVNFLEANLKVNVVNWNKSFIKDPFTPPRFSGYIFSLLKLPLSWPKKIDLMRSVLNDYIKNKFVQRKEWLLAQKVFVFLYHSKLINGENFLFLDGDAMLISDISELLYSKDFDIHVTIRRSHEISLLQGFCQALNSGVILFSGGPDKQHNIIEEWISQMNNQKFEYLIEQTSLTRLIFGSDEDKINQTIITFGLENNYLAKVHTCEKYNYNWIEDGFNPSSNKILHFKGGRRHSRSNIRNLCTGNQLASIFDKVKWWNCDPNQLKMNYLFNNLSSLFEKNVPFLVSCSNSNPFEIKGILNSVLLLFVSLLDYFSINHVIESGRARAQSTTIVSLWLKANRGDCKFDSIEFDRNSPDNKIAVERIKKTNFTVNLLYGDSMNKIPQLLEASKNDKISLLIDGPKGVDAVILALNSLRNSNVKFVAVHDIHRDDAALRSIVELFPCTISSDNYNFVETYKYLDVSCWEEHQKYTQFHDWSPYKRGSRVMKSYGPTLFVILNENISTADLKTIERKLNSLKQRRKLYSNFSKLIPNIIKNIPFVRKAQKILVKAFKL